MFWTLLRHAVGSLAGALFLWSLWMQGVLFLLDHTIPNPMLREQPWLGLIKILVSNVGCIFISTHFSMAFPADGRTYQTYDVCLIIGAVYTVIVIASELVPEWMACR